MTRSRFSWLLSTHCETSSVHYRACSTQPHFCCANGKRGSEGGSSNRYCPWNRSGTWALARAKQARQKLLTAEASRHEAVALRWAKAAKRLTMAVTIEQQANDSERQLAGLRKKATTARALTEENQARLDRAIANLPSLKASPPEQAKHNEASLARLRI